MQLVVNARTMVPSTYNLGTSFFCGKGAAGDYYVAYNNRNWYNTAYGNIQEKKITEEYVTAKVCKN